MPYLSKSVLWFGLVCEVMIRNRYKNADLHDMIAARLLVLMYTIHLEKSLRHIKIFAIVAFDNLCVCMALKHKQVLVKRYAPERTE